MTAGAVLCGGASRRMGTDKALVEVDGVAMAERVATALAAAGCRPVSFIGGDQLVLARYGRPTHEDRWPGEGPVGGVLTALYESAADVVVAACDLGYLDAVTVRTVLEAAAGAAADVDVVVARTARIEPMLAWWRHGGLAAIEAQWSAGRRAVHDVIAGLNAVDVAVEPLAMRNINTPADLP